MEIAQGEAAAHSRTRRGSRQHIGMVRGSKRSRRRRENSVERGYGSKRECGDFNKVSHLDSHSHGLVMSPLPRLTRRAGPQIPSDPGGGVAATASLPAVLLLLL
jgi:hypothetical protein